VFYRRNIFLPVLEGRSEGKAGNEFIGFSLAPSPCPNFYFPGSRREEGSWQGDDFFGKMGTAGERSIHCRAGSLGRQRAGGPEGGRGADDRPPRGADGRG